MDLEIWYIDSKWGIMFSLRLKDFCLAWEAAARWPICLSLFSRSSLLPLSPLLPRVLPSSLSLLLDPVEPPGSLNLAPFIRSFRFHLNSFVRRARDIPRECANVSLLSVDALGGGEKKRKIQKETRGASPQRGICEIYARHLRRTSTFPPLRGYRTLAATES